MKKIIIMFFAIFITTTASGNENIMQCIPNSDSYQKMGSSLVFCGCEFDGYAISNDGKQVCAGGKYDSYR